MQTPNRRRLLIDERLHAQAHPVHTAALQSLNHRGSQRARSAFDGNLRTRLNLKILRNRDEQSAQLRDFQYSRSSAAHVDGVDNPVSAPAHLCYSRVVTFHVSAQPVDVALKHGAGKDIRSKVAVTAFGATERNGDIQTERHSNDYPTCGDAGCRSSFDCGPELIGNRRVFILSKLE